MEKLQSITIERNEPYLRQISKKVNITDPELHNIMPRNRSFRRNFTYRHCWKVIKGTEDERIALRKRDDYTIISKVGNYELLKSRKLDDFEC